MLDNIYNEDCLVGMLRIPDKSIDMVLCDLPYGTTQCKWDVVIAFDALWKQYERIIKANGVIVLTAAEPFTSVLITSNLKMFKYDLVWHKTHPKGHLNAKKAFMRAHENICVFYKKPPTYNPQKTTGHKRKVANTKYEKVADGSQVYGAEKRNTKYDSDERYPLSVITISNADLTNVLHPTQKPVALFEYLIKTYTNEGDTVLDNCSGSGTTAVACINTDRNYICFEKDEQHYLTSVSRVNDVLTAKLLQ
jgi:DNA modification methylase